MRTESARDDVVALFALGVLGAALTYGGVGALAADLAPRTRSALTLASALGGSAAPLVLGPFRGIVAAALIGIAAASCAAGVG